MLLRSDAAADWGGGPGCGKGAEASNSGHDGGGQLSEAPWGMQPACLTPLASHPILSPFLVQLGALVDPVSTQDSAGPAGRGLLDRPFLAAHREPSAGLPSWGCQASVLGREGGAHKTVTHVQLWSFLRPGSTSSPET